MLGCISAANFYFLILYPSTSLNLIISSNRFSLVGRGESLGFWEISIAAALFFFFFISLTASSANKTHFTSFLMWMSFFLVRTKLFRLGLPVLCYIEMMWMRIIALLLILEGKNTHWGKCGFFNKWKNWLSAYRKK